MGLIRKRIERLKKEYEALRPGKESLLRLIDEAELPENVYNSNAIENSTLTLQETEKILMQLEVTRRVSLREVFEAKNLASVSEYVRSKAATAELNEGIILLLHKMLITNINDDFAGRFRRAGEYVRVGTYIAPPPERISELIAANFTTFHSDHESYFSDKIARFHLEFEHTHPFLDGNGRIGRVIMNFQLQRLGFPPIIIRNKEKKEYYRALRDYDQKGDTKRMEKIVALSVSESLCKRTAYLRGDKITPLADFAKKSKKSLSTLINAAHRQTIPAFREKGVWKIA